MACVPQCVLPACGDAHVSADTEAALAFLKRNAPLWTQDGKQMLYRPVAMRLSKDCTALKWQGARGWRDAYGKRLVAPHISWLGLYRLCARAWQSERRTSPASRFSVMKAARHAILMRIGHVRESNMSTRFIARAIARWLIWRLRRSHTLPSRSAESKGGRDSFARILRPNACSGSRTFVPG
jgi:hypothetical protein